MTNDNGNDSGPTIDYLNMCPVCLSMARSIELMRQSTQMRDAKTADGVVALSGSEGENKMIKLGLRYLAYSSTLGSTRGHDPQCPELAKMKEHVVNMQRELTEKIVGDVIPGERPLKN